ncbi:MAG: molybdopterin-guanine dinucleotide biosynthesis protein B [Candidatus Aminicenantes bacterium RBG_16_63_16]|nr:MAG: molybdopterin-guanine dinucleotide biosynthesis protein B [Candidatus Aminicenantes bacterium RBG_16_63_16]
MFIIGIVGRSQSGKTGLIKGLIPELRKKGLRVAAVKHCPHGFTLDLEGKDSWEFMGAGSDGVGMVGPDRVAVIRKETPGRRFSGSAARWFPEADIVLIEGGLAIAGLKKIEVLRKGEKPATAAADLLALVSEGPASGPAPRFRRDEIGAIAGFLEKSALEAEPEIRVAVDGLELPLNPFVRTIFENTILGLVGSLKGGEGRHRSIVIHLLRAASRKPDRNGPQP